MPKKTAEASLDINSLDAGVQCELKVCSEVANTENAICIAASLKGGVALIRAKEILPRGTFLIWLATATTLSPRMAQLHMSAARFARRHNLDATQLSLGAVSELAAKETPKEVVAAAIGLAAQGNPPSANQVRAMKSALATESEAVDESIVTDSDLRHEARELGAVMRRELQSEFLARLIAFLAAASPAEISLLKSALRKTAKRTGDAVEAVA
jgi:hypothetical protein